MPFEIDMLSVGNAGAIILRAWDDYDEKVVVIDGGNTNDGDAVVNNIRTFSNRENCVDLLVNTHPDNDHVNGLPTIVSKLNIGAAWIHDPTQHNLIAKSLINQFAYNRSMIISEAAKSLDSAAQLIKLLDNKGVPRTEPFAGATYIMPDQTSLQVLGPSAGYYEELLARMTEEATKGSVRAPLFSESTYLSAMRSYKSVASARDLLDEDNDRSPTNNSSVIFLLTHKSQSYLFTADAGTEALESAKSFFSPLMQNVYWLQVPHHGSRRNVTSFLLEFFNPTSAFISAEACNEHHPHRAVVQFLREIGSRVYCTSKSGSLWHHADPSATRYGYTNAAELQLTDLP